MFTQLWVFDLNAVCRGFHSEKTFSLRMCAFDGCTNVSFVALFSYDTLEWDWIGFDSAEQRNLRSNCKYTRRQMGWMDEVQTHRLQVALLSSAMRVLIFYCWLSVSLARSDSNGVLESEIQSTEYHSSSIPILLYRSDIVKYPSSVGVRLIPQGQN